MTPSFDETGAIVGYHSNRRAPRRDCIEAVIPLYKSLCEIEQNAALPSQGLSQSLDCLVDVLTQRGQTYDEFVFELINGEKR